MAQEIRLKVWLMGIVPLVLVVGGGVALLVMAGRKPGAPPPSLAAADSPPTGPAPAVDPTPVQTVSAGAPASATASPPAASVFTSYAPAASSVLLSGPPPEPIPELDALYRRKGGEEASEEQKTAYRQKLFADLDTKERSLEREIAAARRSGDAARFKEKSDTLAYLRARRGMIEEMLRRQAAQRDAG